MKVKLELMIIRDKKWVTLIKEYNRDSILLRFGDLITFDDEKIDNFKIEQAHYNIDLDRLEVYAMCLDIESDKDMKEKIKQYKKHGWVENENI